MLIQLNERQRITGIPMNFVLEVLKTRSNDAKNAGEEYWDAVGYYPDLESLLRRMLQRGVEQSEYEGIQNIIGEIKMSVQAIIVQMKLLECEGCNKS